MREDEEPTGEEAEAQREETVMPLVWGGLGLAVVLGFVAWLVLGHSPMKPISPVIAPAERAPQR